MREVNERGFHFGTVMAGERHGAYSHVNSHYYSPHLNRTHTRCACKMADSSLVKLAACIEERNRDQLVELEDALEERSKPRPVEVEYVTKTLVSWWKAAHSLLKLRRSDRTIQQYQEFVEKKQAALALTPFAVDVLDKLPGLIPKRGRPQTPLMHFGWLIPYQLLMALLRDTPEATAAIAQDYADHTIPIYPDNDHYDDDDDEVNMTQETPDVYHYGATLVHCIKKELGLNRYPSDQFFQFEHVAVGLGLERFCFFFAIYNNRDFMTDATIPLPTAEDIQRFQSRLQLSGPPGWWFDMSYPYPGDWDLFTQDGYLMSHSSEE
ncbi:hypothetical protein BDW22DRAFT_1356019 [Trametopsis cervina]|nr:hypothetical protein BDW22DRAFT_1356019 [Trametopsis cervina]